MEATSVQLPYCRGFWTSVALPASVLAGEVVLVHLGLTYGSTAEERNGELPGDDIVVHPSVVTNHAVTIDAPPECVWSWLVQVGWGRAQWYTARRVDRLFFPDNGPSAEVIIPEFQAIEVGDFILDGRPETECGFIVHEVVPYRALVLRSTSRLPRAWRNRSSLDWSWAFVLIPIDEGERTRSLFRSRWVTAPWWLTAGAWLGVVPAAFVMARDMLRGVSRRSRDLALALTLTGLAESALR